MFMCACAESWHCAIDFDSCVVDASPLGRDGHASGGGAQLVTIRHSLWHSCCLDEMNAAAGNGGAVSAMGSTLRFQTELCLAFAPGSVSDVASCDLKVVDIEFEGQSFARGVKDDAKAALKALCLPHLDYMLIWRRPLHRLPVHKDVPRLLKGLLVVGPDGAEIFREDGSVRPSEPRTIIAAIRRLALTLARAVDTQSVVDLIESQFDTYVPQDTGDVAGALRHFLLESGVPEGALFVQIFKAIHQEIIFPAVMSLRTSIYGQMPYKDLKGEWKVRIDIRPTSIHVWHLKWEQTHELDPAEYFKFCWALDMAFDRRMRAMQSATLNVADYAFGPTTTEERERNVERALRPWLAPGTLYKRVWASLGSERAAAHVPSPTTPP